MKDLNNFDLERFKSKNPAVSESALRALPFSLGVETFDFPTEDPKTLIRCIVSTHQFRPRQTFHKITASVVAPNMMRAISPREIYIIKDYLLEKDESISWRYNPSSDRLREATFKSVMNTDYGMNNFVIHLQQYDDEVPDFEKAYSKKTQKNKSFTYSRGSIDNWKFIHVYTKNPFPWTELQAIAFREFGDTFVQVIMNEETRKYPDHYIIWYNPDYQQLV